jgi:SET domain-containing protein
MRNDALVIRILGPKGRGVVARDRIGAKQRIEIAPAIELSEEDTDAIERSVLDHYYFAHPKDQDGGLFVLGFAALMNHSDTPNVVTRAVFDQQSGWQLISNTLRDIDAGEELTRKYSCPVWFDPT